MSGSDVREVLGQDEHEHGHPAVQPDQQVSGGQEGQETQVADEEVQLAGDDGPEGRAPRMIRDPGTPSREEWEQHQTTHVPYRA